MDHYRDLPARRLSIIVLALLCTPVLASADPAAAAASFHRAAAPVGLVRAHGRPPHGPRRNGHTRHGCAPRGAARHGPARAGSSKNRPAGCRAAPSRRPSGVLQVLAAPSTAGLARASMIARVLATPCENAQLMPEPGDLAQIRLAVLDLINRERAANDEVPLVLNRALERAAEGHSEEMISSDYFEHVSPGGSTPVDRVRAAGYIPNPLVGYVIGENLAWGTLALATPQAIVAAWIASPGHLANILEPQYRDTGIGVVAQAPALLANGVAGATYSQEFGVIIR